ncbi:uncharacterized protein B0H18DRAFT_952367 [Fomitopsis serialis]|uniref:uncharacterized protein n=1 Tax=Fomitopsis serialis TaxID=139415 RepID=UPI002007ACFE|nr:uncharacterized protein B0H18DRAFT_952367 [Neoantrodia serialis]KAH9932217.1 hypothetical protein B0H18DRAFT_952367 [Neoantrodia serialis]
MADCVAKIFRRQHRLHVFSVFICKGQARVIRWDRAGAIVSTPIDFREDPSLLHKVIWRYACMTQEQRGFDPTVVRATKKEITGMWGCNAPNGWADLCRHAALGQPGWPVYKIRMQPADLVDERELQPIIDDIQQVEDAYHGDASASSDQACFIVGKRYFATDSFMGRGTKCYIAYEVSRNRLVFLKDYWRSNTHTTNPEGKVLKELRAAGVQGVPTPVAEGDVLSTSGCVQTTLTQALLPEDENTKRRPAVQHHYRLVIEEIGRPLDKLTNALELVGAIYDALEAHRQAWEKQYLHRDISVDNILILDYRDEPGEWQFLGILIDWDQCQFVNYHKGISRPGRAGTWQFMSARLLANPDKEHEVSDDIESIVHVLCWMCLRFFRHSFTGAPNQLRLQVAAMYEGYDIGRDNREIGGATKNGHMLAGSTGFILKAEGSPLGVLLDNLASMCQAHYLALKAQESKPKQHSAPVTNGAMSAAILTRVRKNPTVLEAPEAQPSAQPTPSLKLSDHTAILIIVGNALETGAESLTSLEMTEDQFAAFYKSPVQQRNRERSSQVSSGSKRELEGPAQEGRSSRSKRARTATSGEISSSAEE